MLHLFALGAHFRPLSAELCDRGGVRGCYDLDGGAGIELRRLRRQCPDLVLFGNISADTLQRGTPQQVIAETRDCLSAARELGRIIVGCSGPIAPRTPPENLRAMLQTLERER